MKRHVNKLESEKEKGKMRENENMREDLKVSE